MKDLSGVNICVLIEILKYY